MSNRVVRIDRDGEQHVVVDDSDPHAVARVMTRWADGALTREDLDLGASRALGSLTSITFGGPDLKTAYLGSLASDTLFTFRSPVAGVEPAHWRY